MQGENRHMKSIRRVIRQNHLVVILLTSMFIVVNILVYTAIYSTYQRLLQDYQEVNELFTINNDRKTNFILYSKSHDEGPFNSTMIPVFDWKRGWKSWKDKCKEIGNAKCCTGFSVR